MREVVATYSIDDGSMELLVSLPSNYPLGGLAVESGKRVGVETGQLKGVSQGIFRHRETSLNRRRQLVVARVVDPFLNAEN